MPDVLTKEQRRKNMQHIRSDNTKIEVLLRKALWKKGYRYRKNYKALPGKPDIVLTKYKIEVAKNIIDAYHPDVYVDFNDVATARSLFMSPESYREMIKPHQKEFIDYILSRGVLFEQHCCGKCEDIIEDYVEMGAKLWHSAQSMNDLKGIGKKYKGKLTIEGGWDSSGVPGMITATAEDMRNETRRCLEEYGHDASFILLPVMFSEEGNSVLTGRDARLPAVVDEWNKNKAL